MKFYAIIFTLLLNFTFSWCSNDDEDFSDAGLYFRSVVGPEAHHELLKETIDLAQKNLLITSDSISFLEKDIYQALNKAFRTRGVKIHIYYNCFLNREAGIFLRKISTLQQRNIHAKFLVADENFVIIGSQNWLDFDHSNGYNRSLEIEGDECFISPIKKQIWGRIRHYGNIQHGNNRLNDIPDTILNYSLDSEGNSQFSLLSLLNMHESFFDDVCRTAQKKIQIYSPFVSFNNAVQRLLDAVDLINPGVKIELFIWSNEDSDRLVDFVSENDNLAKHINIYELDQECHNKTIVRDEDLISEGSFNWLSSSLSEESQGHNLDCSLVCKGSKAKNMIANLIEDCG